MSLHLNVVFENDIRTAHEFIYLHPDN